MMYKCSNEPYTTDGVPVCVIMVACVVMSLEESEVKCTKGGFLMQSEMAVG